MNKNLYPLAYRPTSERLYMCGRWWAVTHCYIRLRKIKYSPCYTVLVYEYIYVFETVECPRVSMSGRLDVCMDDERKIGDGGKRRARERKLDNVWWWILSIEYWIWNIGYRSEMLLVDCLVWIGWILEKKEWKKETGKTSGKERIRTRGKWVEKDKSLRWYGTKKNDG